MASVTKQRDREIAAANISPSQCSSLSLPLCLSPLLPWCRAARMWSVRVLTEEDMVRTKIHGHKLDTEQKGSRDEHRAHINYSWLSLLLPFSGVKDGRGGSWVITNLSKSSFFTALWGWSGEMRVISCQGVHAVKYRLMLILQRFICLWSLRGGRESVFVKVYGKV